MNTFLKILGLLTKSPKVGKRRKRSTTEKVLRKIF